MASLSTCHLGIWLGWQILLNLVKPSADTPCRREVACNATPAERKSQVLHKYYDVCLTRTKTDTRPKRTFRTRAACEASMTGGAGRAGWTNATGPSCLSLRSCGALSPRSACGAGVSMGTFQSGRSYKTQHVCLLASHFTRN